MRLTRVCYALAILLLPFTFAQIEDATQHKASFEPQPAAQDHVKRQSGHLIGMNTYPEPDCQGAARGYLNIYHGSIAVGTWKSWSLITPLLEGEQLDLSYNAGTEDPCQVFLEESGPGLGCQNVPVANGGNGVANCLHFWVPGGH